MRMYPMPSFEPTTRCHTVGIWAGNRTMASSGRVAPATSSSTMLFAEAASASFSDL